MYLRLKTLNNFCSKERNLKVKIFESNFMTLLHIYTNRRGKNTQKAEASVLIGECKED